jgi:hypothetical protein
LVDYDLITIRHYPPKLTILVIIQKSVEPDFCPFQVIKALAFSIIRINITETELTELLNGKRKTGNGKLKSAPSVTMEVADESALGSYEPIFLNG